jgi:hypothetical protein
MLKLRSHFEVMLRKRVHETVQPSKCLFRHILFEGNISAMSGRKHEEFVDLSISVDD